MTLVIKRKILKAIGAVVIAIAGIVSLQATAAQVPVLINYQGKIDVQGVAHDGPGYFKFELIDDPVTPTTNYWVNDGGVIPAGAEPTNGVTLPVTQGLFSVKLGDTGLSNMTALDPAVFSNGSVYLRVWFSTDGAVFQQLSPDRQLVSVPYAMRAESANTISGSDVVTGAQITDGTITDSDIDTGASIAASKLNTSGANNLVSRIIAGSGIGLSPSSGVGDVTISVTGGGGTAADVVCTNCVDSSDIANGAVTNSTVAAGAAIDASKLNTSGASNLVSSITAGSGVSVSAGGVGDVTISAVGSGGTVTSVGTGAGLTGGPVTGSGTISIATGGVTSSMIADGDITNVDIAAGAAIAAGKIADGAGSGLDADTVDGKDSTSFAASGANSDITSTSALTSIARATGGSLDISTGSAAGDDFAVDADKLVVEGDTGNVGVGTAAPQAALHLVPGTAAAVRIDPFGSAAGDTGEVRFQELAANGGNYAGFKAPDTLAGNAMWVLPGSDGSPNQFLQTDGSGNLTWADPAGSGDITDVTAGGGLTGGGTSGAVTLDIGAGTGIVVNANDVAVDVGTSANQVVQLDGSGHLPVVDGSALTGLNGSSVASGTVGVNVGGTGATTAAGARGSLGAAASGANSDITSLTGLTTPLSLSQGGTAANTAAGARSSLGAAASGANSDITSLSGLTTALSIAQGGTGAASAAAARSALGAAASGANTDITALGALSSLKLPASTAPTLSSDGDIALETDADAVNIQAGSNAAGGVPANTPVALPLIQQKDITLLQPNLIQGVSDAIPMFTVDAYNYPNGITITAIRLATSASSSLAINVEDWTSPTDGAPTTIDNIATSGSTEQTETAITNPAVAAGDYVFLNLDTTAVDWAKVTVWYYVND